MVRGRRSEGEKKYALGLSRAAIQSQVRPENGLMPFFVYVLFALGTYSRAEIQAAAKATRQEEERVRVGNADAVGACKAIHTSFGAARDIVQESSEGPYP